MMLEKITNYESLGISQENFYYDAVSFCKVTKLQCSDCEVAIKRTHQILSGKYTENVYVCVYVLTECLKKNKKKKSSF